MITRKGTELAWKLAPSIGYSRDIANTCSLICRHATTYARLQEMSCNGHPAQEYWPTLPVDKLNKLQDKWDAYIEKREQQIVARLTELVQELPDIEGAPIDISFQGDPRGATVKLVLYDGRTDDWGQTGICVPGS